MNQHDPQDRIQAARIIASHPDHYQICLGCEAIVRRDVRLCPQCRSYRFDLDRKHIFHHAASLALTGLTQPVPADYQ